MADRYIIGTSDVPNWCEKKIMPYRKSDGSVGYEFTERSQDYELSKGDVLVYESGRISVIRKG